MSGPCCLFFIIIHILFTQPAMASASGFLSISFNGFISLLKLTEFRFGVPCPTPVVFAVIESKQSATNNNNNLKCGYYFYLDHINWCVHYYYSSRGINVIGRRELV